MPVDQGEKRTLKRYRNRRLYDPVTREQVTLAHVRDLVRSGVEFRIADNDTGKDVTTNVLAQVLADDIQGWKNLEETTTVLRLLIRRGGDSSMAILSKTVLAAIGALAITKENAEKWIDELIKRGELNKSERAAAVREAVEKAEARTKETVQKVSKTVSEKYKEVEKGIEKRFSKSKEVEDLKKAVQDLTDKVEELTARLHES